MTRQEVVDYGMKRYGFKDWINKLAKDINYERSSLGKMADGGDKKVTRRMELEMKALMRKHTMDDIAKPRADYR